MVSSGQLRDRPITQSPRADRSRDPPRGPSRGPPSQPSPHPQGPWLHDPVRAGEEFRKWLHALRAAFPPRTKDAHFFGARSHGNELEPWFDASQLSWLVDAKNRSLVNKAGHSRGPSP